MPEVPINIHCPECSNLLVSPQESAQERLDKILPSLYKCKKIEMDLLEVVEADLPKEQQWGLINKVVPRYYREGEARDKMHRWNATKLDEFRIQKGYLLSIHQINRFTDLKSPSNYPKNASQWLEYFTEQVQKYQVEILDTINHHVPDCGCVVCRNCGYNKCG